MRILFMKAIRVWVVFYVLAVVNGLLRETFYIPQWGEFSGRIAGSVFLPLAMLVVMYVFLRRNAAALTRVRVLGVGVLWLALSFFFEFAVSHWVMEEPWEMIMAHYNVMAGRFRVLVRLVEIAGPIVLGGRLMASRYAGPPVEAVPADLPQAEAPEPEPVEESTEQA